MQISAEIRWFHEGHDERVWSEWFASEDIHSFAPFDDAERTDAYLLDPSTTELGIKRRDGRRGTELKCLIGQADGQDLPPLFHGTVQHWGKWMSAFLDVGAHNLAFITKKRLLRKFVIHDGVVREQVIVPSSPGEAPSVRSGRGAFLELTSIIHYDGSLWTSIGFESFGALGELSDSLRVVAEHLVKLRPPTLHGWNCASYPQWLATENAG